MRKTSSALKLPCKLAWTTSGTTELRGYAIELTNASALIRLENHHAVLAPTEGTKVQFEVLLPKGSLPVAKCIAAKATVERSTEVGVEDRLITCKLSKPHFKDCDDPQWLVLAASKSAWTM